MSLGPFIVDIAGLEVDAEDREILRHPLVGGLILFSRNYADTEQLAALMDELRRLRPEMLVCVDHEGGRVQRFRDGFSPIPPMACFAEIHADDPARAIGSARQAGWLLAAELRSFDIDLAFAPVLDLNYGVSSIIGDRAFGADAGVVGELAGALMGGMRSAGMAATGKHFPGHGAIAADSHLELPVDDRPLEEIMRHDVMPFRALMEYGLDSIMPAHIVYSQVDDLPAGFSPKWVNGILRGELGFDGAVFSDDLSMAGAACVGGYCERSEAALEAGCDLLLVCNNRDGAVELLDRPGRAAAMPAISGQRAAALRANHQPEATLAALQQTTGWKAGNRLCQSLTQS